MRGKAVRAGVKGSWKRRVAARLPALLLVAAAAALLVGVPLAAGAAYRYVARLPYFAVTDVRVDGLRYVRREDFISYIGDPRGTSLLDYDTAAALKKASEHPWVRSAVVRRDFPHTLRFELLERAPAAVAATRSGSYLVDAEGLAVARVAGPGWEFLPVVQYRPAGGLAVMDAAGAEGMRLALSLMRALREEPSERLSGSAVMVCEDGLPAISLRGAVVRVGRDGYAEKVKRLADVDTDLLRRGARPSVIDLRFPGKVIVGEAAQRPPQAQRASKGGE